MEKKVYSTSGKELRTITLDDKVFGLPVNDDVIYYAITNELANKRVGTACTKTRAEVHGTNNKPYKQKVLVMHVVVMLNLQLWLVVVSHLVQSQEIFHTQFLKKQRDLH